MKKVLALFLLIIFSISLVACNTATSKSPKSTEKVTKYYYDGKSFDTKEEKDKYFDEKWAAVEEEAKIYKDSPIVGYWISVDEEGNPKGGYDKNGKKDILHTKVTQYNEKGEQYTLAIDQTDVEFSVKTITYASCRFTLTDNKLTDTYSDSTYRVTFSNENGEEFMEQATKDYAGTGTRTYRYKKIASAEEYLKEIYDQNNG